MSGFMILSSIILSESKLPAEGLLLKGGEEVFGVSKGFSRLLADDSDLVKVSAEVPLL
jgi:hypothetical protein